MSEGASGDSSGFGWVRILAMLPHRYPFLMVDRMESLEPDVRAVGIKAVSINEPFFQGHFPGRPIMPGVLIIEALAQTAGIHAVTSMGAAAEGKLVYFMSIEAAKFRKPVEPGVILRLEVVQERVRGPVRKYKGTAWMGDQVAAEAEFTAMIADRPA
jgi:3-hydroxyacyl-[acyl-carrier-protein] dehydratase